MKVYEIVTERILKKLEEGTIPWHKPWSGGEMPKNFITNKEYRGVNTFLLNLSGYSSPFWLTFKQAKDKKGYVKQGEKSTMVVYWDTFKRVNDDGEEDTIPFLKYYNVFNIEQTSLPVPAVRTHHNNPIPECERIVANMPNFPEIVHGDARAYYRSSDDLVNMPAFNLFDSPEEYYSTLFHELTHSTGHSKRLNRASFDGQIHFGSEKYAKEELIAEMGAAFMAGHTGIELKTIDNSASYISSWLKRLKNDPKLVIVAAGQAQKATDYILGKVEQ